MGAEKAIGWIIGAVVVFFTGKALLSDDEPKKSLTPLGPQKPKRKKTHRGRGSMAHKVFFSFHFANDVFRVQQIRNIGAIHGDMPVSPQDWEKAKNTKGGVEKWIDDHMNNKDCVIVLVGSETHARPWVQHEIKKAWQDGKGLFGIHINDINCMKNGTCSRGPNPFDQFSLDNGKTLLSSIIPCHTPPSHNAYQHISEQMDTWVKTAIRRANSQYKT